MLTSPGGFSRQMLVLKLLTGKEFFDNLTADIAATKAGDRILLTTMAFNAAEADIHILMCEVRKAVDRGVILEMGIDAYEPLGHRAIGPVVTPWVFKRRRHRHLVQIVEDLERRETAVCRITNLPTRRLPTANLLAGRNHIKAAIVNNRVYVGGPNLRDTDRLDLVVTLVDGRTADWLFQLMSGVIRSGNTSVLGQDDFVFQVDPVTDLVFDVGRRGQSAILHQAHRIISEADKWLDISCQFLPTGRTGDLLVAALDRVDTRIWLNHYAQQPGSAAHWLIELRERRIRPPEFFRLMSSRGATLLHASGIANEREGIVTAHNFVGAGVRLGTAEMALHRRHPDFAASVSATLERLITGTAPSSPRLAA